MFVQGKPQRSVVDHQRQLARFGGQGIFIHRIMATKKGAYFTHLTFPWLWKLQLGYQQHPKNFVIFLRSTGKQTLKTSCFFCAFLSFLVLFLAFRLFQFFF